MTATGRWRYDCSGRCQAARGQKRKIDVDRFGVSKAKQSFPVMHSILNSKLLTRYWFPATQGLGIGVTAYSLPHATEMALSALSSLPSGARLGEPVANVDVSSLDQGHVVPNMGPCNFEGIWYPARSL